MEYIFLLVWFLIFTVVVTSFVYYGEYVIRSSEEAASYLVWLKARIAYYLNTIFKL